LAEQLRDGAPVSSDLFGELFLALINLTRLKGYQAENCLHDSLGKMAASGDFSSGFFNPVGRKTTPQ
jgi:hypothetical protein